MNDLHEARVEAAAKVLYEYGCYGLRTWADHATTSAQDNYREKVTAVLAAADAVVTVDGLQERIEDTLAYYQCRETNPKADHPSMGYYAFSEEQREWLRSKKSEAAAEIVRMIIDLLRGGEER